MKTIKYQIEFYSYWHTSSGLAGNTYADLLVNKNRKGFPYIPGRTLKGLLREAAEMINEFDKMLITDSFIADIFGQAPTANDIQEGTFAKEALSFFTNAELTDYLQDNLSESQKKFLFKSIASTAIGDNGLAKPHSLRQIEVTIPLTLQAKIEQFPDNEDYVTQIDYCFGWIKRMGLNRSRGLGRCRFSQI